MERGTAGRDRQLRLLDELQRSAQEMTGQQLHRCLQDKPGAMGLATVYRNLRQLQRQGKVRCRHLPTGEALYAPVERDGHRLADEDAYHGPGAVAQGLYSGQIVESLGPASVDRKGPGHAGIDHFPEILEGFRRQWLGFQIQHDVIVSGKISDR